MRKEIFSKNIIVIFTTVVLFLACSDKGDDPENRAPDIISASSVTVFIDSLLSYTATATDPDGTTPSINFENIPSWLDTSGVVISGTALSTTADTSFTVIATDDLLADTLQVTVDVTIPQSAVSYSSEVQPILSSRCAGSSCHIGGSSAGLQLGSYTQLMNGSNSGAIVIAGNADGSILVRQIEGTRTPQMPYGQQALTGSQIQAIRDWIDEGAQNN